MASSAIVDEVPHNLSINNNQSLEKNEDFTNINLDVKSEDERPQKKQKVPRRILHFSDGTLEEYSTDEEEDEADGEEPIDPWSELIRQPKRHSDVDPSTLSWFPWMKHHLSAMSFGALSAADFCGEKLAWFFGITSPKYQYAIDEYNRLQREEKEEKEREEREMEAERRRMGEQYSEIESGYNAKEAAQSGVDNKAFSADQL